MLRSVEIGEMLLDISQDKENKIRFYANHNFEHIPQLSHLSAAQQFSIRVTAQVFPFRVNQYVLGLIDWDNIPADPIFRLVFPQREMLEPEHYDGLADLIRLEADPRELKNAVARIRESLNPHPADQTTLNLPLTNSEPLEGTQHKYKETLLFFPSQGQTCQSYCTFCFRWAQFVGDKNLRIASHETDALHDYLRSHHEISDLLVTGGDPMVMSTNRLERYIRPLLHAEFDHIQNIRLGTKSLSFWPYRFLTDHDSDQLMRLFEELVAAGKHVALMAHVEHWRELEGPIVEDAVKRILSTGAVIRTQAPVLRHINDSADVWARLWRQQVGMGMVPYYMFVERDTGARRYFEIPLVQAHEIYRDAIQQVSGLARTVRGPSMSASPGKVHILGTTEIAGEKVFSLQFLQAREPDWVHRPFFAAYDPKATWWTDLKPAFGADKFFFQEN